MSRLQRLGVLALAGLLSFVAGSLAFGLHDWNDSGIAWAPLDKGLETARAQKKPLCLVIYTEWCPHCANYSRVFHDPQIVEMSARFVMVRLDKDKSPEMSARYAVDGQYIPRTYFLSPEGTVEAAIHAPREKFQYFYDEKDPASLLAGMKAALETPGKAQQPQSAGAATTNPAPPPATSSSAPKPDEKPQQPAGQQPATQPH